MQNTCAMNQKINLQELVIALAEKMNITKKEAETFIKDYFSLIEEALFRDKIVKIKGVGTFKLIPVKERSSVDVNTGNPMVIPAHYKISYIPDVHLAEVINEPFALFESVEVASDALAETEESGPEMEEQDEITSEPAVEAIIEQPAEEMVETPKEELIPEVEKQVEAIEETPIVVEEEPVIEEETPVESEAIQENESLVEEVAEETNPNEEQEVISESTNEDDKKTPASGQTYFKPVDPEREKRKFNWLPWISVLLLLAIIGIVIFVQYEENKHSKEIESLYQRQSETVVADSVQSDADQLVVDEVAPEEDLNVEPETAQQAEKVEEPSHTEPEKPMVAQPKPVQTKPEAKPAVQEKTNPTQAATPAITRATGGKIRKLQSGETLRIVAEKEFGSRDFWIYIYLKNQDKIKNPNNVSVGISLVIPDKAEFGGIDANDPESLKRARNEAAKI
ncbi:HU family DNA-binding protein [Bacteroidales bacterium OttesenSCG-928-L03]|nr:HU family DNA-binding protein [Bacteroidales bacterium OttesenSCG-928-L03]